MSEINHKRILAGDVPAEVSLAGTDPAVALDLYRFMQRLRQCEQALIDEYHPADEIRCPVHFCLGQEAASAALSLLLRGEDYMFSHHRSHGYYLAKGAPMNALFAELYGRTTGANGGMAGSQEISCDDVHFYSGAILTGATGIAVGTAMALQLQEEDAIVCAGFGDGATDEGMFWESISLASVRRLPIVFLCENNGYATYSPQWKRQRLDNLHQRVASFGVESTAVFGNDAVWLHQTLNRAITAARAGEGPFFIEAYTYRWNGHVGPENDDASVGYRPTEEVAFWKDRCPIRLLEAALVRAQLLDESKKQQIITGIDAEIAAAFEFAKTSPFPQNADWDALNCRTDAPVAAALLREFDEPPFDQNQCEAIPGPY